MRLQPGRIRPCAGLDDDVEDLGEDQRVDDVALDLDDLHQSCPASSAATETTIVPPVAAPDSALLSHALRMTRQRSAAVERFTGEAFKNYRERAGNVPGLDA